jgi:hypothetical protein
MGFSSGTARKTMNSAPAGLCVASAVIAIIVSLTATADPLEQDPCLAVAELEKIQESVLISWVHRLLFYRCEYDENLAINTVFPFLCGCSCTHS